jgi:hypothetical protein
MLMHLQRLWKHRADCVALFCAGLGAWWLLSVADCVGYQDQTNHYNSYENLAVYGVCFETPFARIASFIHCHHEIIFGAISVLATLAIAAFTGRLWYSTEKLWKATSIVANAALRQANAAVAVESPIPTVLQIKLVEYRDERDRVGIGDHVVPGVLPNMLRALVLIRNTGRTEMFFESFCLDWIVSDTLPIAPPYERVRPLEGALPGLPGRSPQIWLVNFEDIFIPTPQQHAVIADGTQFLWVFGYISYLNFMRDRSVIGFLGRWDIAEGFVREPNPRYEYRS